MVGMGSKEKFITSWGWRNGKRVWRIRWDQRPGAYAEVTGPEAAIDALMKCSDEVLARLPWQMDAEESA